MKAVLGEAAGLSHARQQQRFRAQLPRLVKLLQLDRKQLSQCRSDDSEIDRACQPHIERPVELLGRSSERQPVIAGPDHDRRLDVGQAAADKRNADFDLGPGGRRPGLGLSLDRGLLERKPAGSALLDPARPGRPQLASVPLAWGRPFQAVLRRRSQAQCSPSRDRRTRSRSDADFGCLPR